LSHSDLYAEVDRSAYTNAIAKCSPTTKAFFAISALILTVSAQSIIVPITIFAICTILILGFAKVKSHLYLDLFFYPTLMITLSCIIIALFGSGVPLIQISLPWTNLSLLGGISFSVNTFFRVEGALSCLFFLVLTTSITDLCIILRRAHVPRVLVELSLLIYRYIFVFLEVSEKMNTAQKLRLRPSGWIKKISSLALLAGSLFIRTLEQGERTLVAMNARGYDGTIRVLEDFPAPRKIMLLGIVVFDVVFVALIFLTMNFGVLI
jgi:cobalt/nickel transport system permease protein